MPAGNYIALSTFIINIILENKKRKQMAINAKKDALKYSTEKMIKKHETLYLHLMRNSEIGFAK